LNHAIFKDKRLNLSKNFNKRLILRCRMRISYQTNEDATKKQQKQSTKRKNKRITCWRNIGVSSRFAKCIFLEIVLEFGREGDSCNGWFPREKEKRRMRENAKVKKK